MKIIIGGDVVPTKSNIKLFEEGKILENLDCRFSNIWNRADYRIFNLELPICDKLQPIIKNGPNLSCSSKTIKGICELNPNLLLLSNNHILDHGITGLEFTLKILKENNIPWIGIIDNSTKKNNAHFFKKEEIKVGVYNVCDFEFSIATKDSKGAAPLNIFKCYDEIKEIKKNCDYLVVIYHGGKECYRYPSPYLKELCEFLTKIGADIVICQHTHCIGAEEKIDNKTIIYGQGNFIFDVENNEYFDTSLILEIDFQKNGYEINYIPIEKYNNLFKISENKGILKEFYERSAKITDDNFLESEFEKFALTKINDYMSAFYKKNVFTKFINKYIKNNFYVSLYKNKELACILNYIDCIAHREVLIKGLNKVIKNAK